MTVMVTLQAARVRIRRICAWNVWNLQKALPGSLGLVWNAESHLPQRRTGRLDGPLLTQLVLNSNVHRGIAPSRGAGNKSAPGWRRWNGWIPVTRLVNFQLCPVSCRGGSPKYL